MVYRKGCWLYWEDLKGKIWVLFHLVRIGLLLPSNLQETSPSGWWLEKVCTADDYMDVMAGMATLLGSLLYAGATCQSFDDFFQLQGSPIFFEIVLFLPATLPSNFSTKNGGKTKRRKKTSQNTHETMQIYGKFEGFSLV